MTLPRLRYSTSAIPKPTKLETPKIKLQKNLALSEYMLDAKQILSLLPPRATKYPYLEYKATRILPPAGPVFAKYPLQEPAAPLKVLAVGQSGYGICADDSGWLFLVPTVIAGETVVVKPYQHGPGISIADLVSVKDSAQNRIAPHCKLFSKCSSCAYQHMTYSSQIEHKQRGLERFFESLLSAMTDDAKSIWAPFEPSPVEFGFRTKLSVHHGNIRAGEAGAMGFLERGKFKSVVDVDHCPLATEAVNQGLKEIRTKYDINGIKDFNRTDRTYFVRQTLVKSESIVSAPLISQPTDPISLQNFVETDSQSQKRSPLVVEPSNPVSYTPENFKQSFTTHYDSVVTDKVNDFIFQTPANSFFQLNPNLLPKLISYTYSQLAPHSADLSTLIDVYCGSGLFAITQSKLFKRVIGIDLDVNAISHARENAVANNICNTQFISGDVRSVFPSIETLVRQTEQHDTSFSKNVGDTSAVILDPPSRGCNSEFLQQVMRLNPRIIIYISSNSGTQIRDLNLIRKYGEEGVPPPSFVGSMGVMLRGEEERGKLSRVEFESQSRVLYLGGKKITRGANQEIRVEDIDANQFSPRMPNMQNKISTLLKVRGYFVAQIKAFDMFPQSGNSEVVVTLVRK